MTQTKNIPKPLHSWWLAIRPKTLSASIAPIILGNALAAAAQSFRLLPALATLFTALALQIGTNLFNDSADFSRGIDTPLRLGPPRVTALGYLSAAAVRRGAYLAFLLATIFGSYLAYLGGLPVVLIGILSILAGLAYSAGPYPLSGLSGVSDLLVFLFFGLVAVSGPYYIQTLHLSSLLWAPASALGCLSTAILVCNNLRDRFTDATTHKKTLAVRFGENFTRLEYTVLIILAYSLPLYSCYQRYNLERWPLKHLLPYLSLGLGYKLFRAIIKERLDGRELNNILGQTAKLELFFALLWALGVVL